MLLKCACTHCSSHLEFESEHVGTVISCPQCNKPTKLAFENGPTPAAVTSPDRRPLTGAPKETLKAVRAQTCYRTLRVLINVMQIIAFVIAGVTGAFAVFMSIANLQTMSAGPDIGAFKMISYLSIFGWICTPILFVVIAIAGKQALLLLVDIADCQIQQCAHGK